MLRLVGFRNPDFRLRLCGCSATGRVRDTVINHFPDFHGAVRYQHCSLHAHRFIYWIRECTASETMVQTDHGLHSHVWTWTDYRATSVQGIDSEYLHRRSRSQGSASTMHADSRHQVHPSWLPRTLRSRPHTSSKHADRRLLRDPHCGLCSHSACFMPVRVLARSRDRGTALGSSHWECVLGDWVCLLCAVFRLVPHQPRSSRKD